MILNATQTELLQAFAPDIFLEISINEIAQRLKKHYRVVRVNLNTLVKGSILKSRPVAGARLISINLMNPVTGSVMTHVEESMGNEHLFHALPQAQNLITSARELGPFFCLGMFGSYAKNTQKKGSDIDLFLICPKEQVKTYQNLINQFPAIQDRIDWNVFSDEEFRKGLKAKGTLVYKEIAKNKLLLSGGAIFYNIIEEAGTIED